MMRALGGCPACGTRVWVDGIEDPFGDLGPGIIEEHETPAELACAASGGTWEEAWSTR